jgi:transposase InsO family protein
MNRIESQSSKQSKDSKTELRIQATFALLKGESVKTVSAKFGICRNSLYKLRARAIDAVRREIENPTKIKSAHNRLLKKTEEDVVKWCRRCPTLSSDLISRKLKTAEEVTVNPRTIQRIRRRYNLPRIPKRAAPISKSNRLTAQEKLFIRRYIKDKLFLGGDRLAWDLQNRYRIKISRSTAKRIKRNILCELNPRPPKPKWQFYERKHPHRLWHGDLMEKVTLTDENRTAFQLTLLDDYSRAYVFCDLFREVTVNTTIQAIIAAMRQYQTIPHAIVFDNGSFFKGKLLQEFCRQLGIRLIHTAVHHPQTNGKLERAFRDDMNEFYRHFDEWQFQKLKERLPECVNYRNRIRGHYALCGKPSFIRLDEQDFFALPKILDTLEKFAWCERKPKRVSANGLLFFNQRRIVINSQIAGQKLRIFETLDGLEAEDENSKLYFLPEYKNKISRPVDKFVNGILEKDTQVYYFSPICCSQRLSMGKQMLRAKEVNDNNLIFGFDEENCPYLAVAQ